MDTASHLLFGVTLAGLSQIDPVVAQNPSLAQAVMIGTLIGSHAPDFDTVVRIKGFSAYLRHHRGITHSIPALFIWPLLITIPLAWGFHLGNEWFHLLLWTFFAVVFHVLLDMLNSYGVQCLRPFTKNWIHRDALAIFDAFLFSLHAAGLGFWVVFHANPAVIFSLIYGITFGYIGLRVWHHHYLLNQLKRQLQLEGVYQIIPGLHWFHWQYVAETDSHFYTGKIRYNRIIPEEVYSKTEKNPIVEATMATDGVRVFLAFAQLIHVSYKELQDGYEVRWSDVRFWHNRQLPFGVDVRLDRNLNVVDHSLGWRKKAWDPPFV